MWNEVKGILCGDEEDEKKNNNNTHFDRLLCNKWTTKRNENEAELNDTKSEHIAQSTNKCRKDKQFRAWIYNHYHHHKNHSH